MHGQRQRPTAYSFFVVDLGMTYIMLTHLMRQEGCLAIPGLVLTSMLVITDPA